MRKPMAVFRLFGDIEIDRVSQGKTMEGGLARLSRQMEEFFYGKNGADAADYEPALLINSRGGSTEEALGLYAFLCQFPKPVTTVGLGFVESAAMFVYLAGHHRIALPTTMFLVHGGDVKYNGPVSEVEAFAQGNTLKQRLIVDIISSRSKATPRTVRHWLQFASAFSTEEAVRHGIAHEVVSDSILRERGFVYADRDSATAIPSSP